MKKILIIHSSVRSEGSISRELADTISRHIKGDSNQIIVRDLAEGIHFITEQSLAAVKKIAEERSEEENHLASLSDELIRELEWADYLIVGLPMYNFGPPASLKAWADLVAREGTTFKYTESGPKGQLKGKKAFIVAVTGGTAVNSDIDFMTPWMKHFLKFIGITTIESIVADGIYREGGDIKILTAKQIINRLII